MACTGRSRSPRRIAEVQYRFCLLISGIAMSAGPSSLVADRQSWAWVWVLPLCIGLGLALRWIHIYLRPLHQVLQLFWPMGCLGWLLLMWKVSPGQPSTPLASIPFDPGRRPPVRGSDRHRVQGNFSASDALEAVGLTLLLPIALLGRLTVWSAPAAAWV